MRNERIIMKNKKKRAYEMKMKVRYYFIAIQDYNLQQNTNF